MTHARHRKIALKKAKRRMNVRLREARHIHEVIRVYMRYLGDVLAAHIVNTKKFSRAARAARGHGASAEGSHRYWC